MRRAVVTTVALPNGIGPSGAPRVSLFLAPQLESDEGDRLALFPAFLDWPAVLNRAGVGYVVEVAGHGAVAASVVSAAPSSELWRALFRSGHRVDSRPEAGTGDSAFVQKSMKRIRNICSSGCTAILVSHTTGILAAICSRVTFCEGL